MQETWQHFLQQRGATIQDNDVVDCATEDLNITTTLLAAPLSGFSTLAVGGKDRHTFLQGQLINDLNLIEKPAAQISAWCNPKGQVITNLLVVNTGTAYLLIFKSALKAYVQKRLSLFIMRSDVTIDDISETSPLMGLANTHDLSALGPNMPTMAGQVHAIADLIIICHPDNSGRYLLTGNSSALIKNLPKLNSTLASSAVWMLLDILAGLPWITTATQEQFLPQMLNLDALQGLSYQKGCYLGQEVIARLHYRGKVKKRLHLISSARPLATASHLYVQASNNNIGTVLNSAIHPDGAAFSLAVIELDNTKETLYTDTATNDAVSIIAHPGPVTV